MSTSDDAEMPISSQNSPPPSTPSPHTRTSNVQAVTQSQGAPSGTTQLYSPEAHFDDVDDNPTMSTYDDAEMSIPLQNSPPLSTPPPNTRTSNVQAVTQSQGATSGTIQLYSPTAHFDDIDDDFVEQSPCIRTPARNPNLNITPVQDSPTYGIHSSAAALLSLAQTNPLLRELGREHQFIRSKTKRKCFSAEDSILHFLRSQSISAIAASTTIPQYNFGNVFKTAYNDFTSIEVTASLKPFPMMNRKLIMDYPPPLSKLHHCLLIEDIMLLKKGDSIVCLLSNKHNLFSNNNRNWKNKFLSSWIVDPLRHVQFQKQVYFCVSLTVRSNPTLPYFQDGTLEEQEIASMCTFRGGSGITCTFPNNETELFKFAWFLDEPKDIMLWQIRGVST
jgi:hypothetical protein